MTEEEFFSFCQLNQDYHFERTSWGEIIVMTPTGSETGNRNFKLSQQLANWTDIDGTGIGFDSSTGFTLPNGANRSPDAAWIRLERWEAIPSEQRVKFAPICPDFIIEMRSPSDQLKPLQDKMSEYIANGAALGWLIDRKNRQVYIYRPTQPLEILDNPEFILGEGLVTGFRLEMAKIW
jgi:Uma2 family endonuclease